MIIPKLDKNDAIRCATFTFVTNGADAFNVRDVM